jgi:hypothetical protein
VLRCRRSRGRRAEFIRRCNQQVMDTIDAVYCEQVGAMGKLISRRLEPGACLLVYHRYPAVGVVWR